MRYYFKLSESSVREKALMNGDRAKPITLYAETPQIAYSAEHNIKSDWWGVYRFGTPSTEWADFESMEEALSEYYTCEGVEMYEKIHDL